MGWVVVVVMCVCMEEGGGDGCGRSCADAAGSSKQQRRQCCHRVGAGPAKHRMRFTLLSDLFSLVSNTRGTPMLRRWMCTRGATVQLTASSRLVLDTPIVGLNQVKQLIQDS